MKPVNVYSHAHLDVKLTVCSSLWIILSSIVIIFDKWIMDRFPFSITLTTCHMLCTTAATQVLARTSDLVEIQSPISWSTYARTFIPISICYCGSLVLSNMSYLYVSISFIQMFKTLAPVAAVIACWSLQIDDPPRSMTVHFVIGIITLGVLILSYAQLSTAPLGILIQGGAIVCEAYRAALQQKLLVGRLKMSSIALLYYFAPICAIINCFGVLIFESKALGNRQPSQLTFSIFLANGVLAFTLHLLTLIIIKKTSSVVLTLGELPKSISMICLDIAVYSTRLSRSEAIGFSLAGAGTYGFSTLKSPDSPEKSLPFRVNPDDSRHTEARKAHD